MLKYMLNILNLIMHLFNNFLRTSNNREVKGKNKMNYSFIVHIITYKIYDKRHVFIHR